MFAGAPEHTAWQPAPPARSAAIDVMRAVAIMLVVFGHVQRGLFQTGEASGLYWDAVYPVVDYFIYVFHVPVFFATSGVLLERHGERTRRQFGARIGRLVLLYLLWNTINAIPAVVFSGYINRSFGKAGYLDAINPLHVNGIMWFFFALICAQTLHVLTRRQQWVRLIAIGLAVVVLALDRDFHGAAYGSLWLLLGAEVARRKQLDDASNGPQQAGLSCAGYLTAGAACYVLGVPYTLAIPACAFALHALYCAGQSRAEWPAALTSIGKATLAIYVMHVLVVAGLRIALLKGLQTKPTVMLIVVLTLAGIVLPIAILSLLRRLGLSRWLLLD
ncbi:MAG TPA: acyltransferase [Bradyrhizobium sp.]|nr:acyltransferase [Bradyrhizobium sp.]